MPRPVLVKLGGAVITDKSTAASFRKPVARRLLAELHKAAAPAILVHGAGSYGHPVAKKHSIGEKAPKPEAVGEVLAAVADLHSQMLTLAADVGLPGISVPLHLLARSEGGSLSLPSELLGELVQDGFLPILSGTLVRDDELGWRVAGGDEIMATLAHDLPGPVSPRVACFVTDVDGLFDKDPAKPGAKLIARAGADLLVDGANGNGTDVTGRMQGKIDQARLVAARCPVILVNGSEKNRLLDALRGKPVVGTWVEG